MVQRVVVMLTDDLDGNQIPDGKGETVQFGLDGTSYEIDLADKNAKAMRDLMGKYVEKARRTSGSGSGASRGRGGGRSSAGSSNQRDYDPKEVRAWAHEHDLKVPERGRIPTTVLLQFKEAVNS